MRSRQHIRVWHPPMLPGVVLYRGSGVTHRYPRHWHEELTISAYTAGVGRLLLGGATRSLGAGDFALTPAGAVHENWVTPGSATDYRSAYIELAVLEKMACDLAGRRCAPRFNQLRSPAPAARAALVRLGRAVEANAPALSIEEQFLEVCRALFGECAETPIEERRAGRENRAVRVARDYLEAHLDETVTLDQLAALTRLNPFYLHRAFCRDTGMPPHAFQLQARVNRAKQLVRAGAPLAQVAAATGFADQAHLTRHFRRFVGVPPGRFRAEGSGR